VDATGRMGLMGLTGPIRHMGLMGLSPLNNAWQLKNQLRNLGRNLYMRNTFY